MVADGHWLTIALFLGSGPTTRQKKLIKLLDRRSAGKPEGKKRNQMEKVFVSRLNDSDLKRKVNHGG